MKEFINQFSDPIYSFPLVCVMFYFMIVKIEVFASKKFGWFMTIASAAIFGWCCTDATFWKIITKPDNIPIIILLVLTGWTLWFSLHKAVENDKRLAVGEPPLEGTPENREKVWCWPNLVYTELFAIIACTVFLMFWAVFFKAPLEEPANPTWAPNPAKAPWYFLGLQEMLVYFDPWMAGVVVPGIMIVGLMAVPFIDTNPKGNGYFCFKDRKFAITSFLFGWLILWLFLIIIGTFLRGPNWTFYGPFEYWDWHKVVSMSNINLSEIFWVKFLGTAMPSNIIIREFLGLVLTAAYFVIPTVYINRKWGASAIEKLGQIRYYITIFLVLGMMSLPVKMFLRWTLDLKYIVAMPEFELNL